MPRGPLPNPDAVRRNAPTIPTTELPASGRPGPVPAPPAWAKIPARGPARSWWNWAWKTPEAALWSTGDMQVVARLAKLMGGAETEDPKVGSMIDRLESKLGFGAKAKLDMRAKVVADEGSAAAAGSDEVARRRQERRKRVQGASAAAGS